jgi:hypothetical protein
VDGDGGVAEAGGDPQDGLLGGCAGQQPGLQGMQGGVPADDGERLAGADAGAGGYGAAEGVAVQEVPWLMISPAAAVSAGMPSQRPGAGRSAPGRRWRCRSW